MMECLHLYTNKTTNQKYFYDKNQCLVAGLHGCKSAYGC
jgi:hypothetical protein